MSVEVIADRTPTRGARHARAPILWPWFLVAAAWLPALAATGTNHQFLLDHHWLMEESDLPWPIVVAVFLASWQVMMLAMMLPASMAELYKVTLASRRERHPRLLLVSFLAGYLLVWTAFALLAFIAGAGESFLAGSWLWLGTHSWVIGAGSLAVAGLYQFSPMKQRYLTACRHSDDPLAGYRREGARGAWRQGIGHGLSCLGCAWALMLLMFALNIGSLLGMAVLAVAMIVENAVSGEQRIRIAVGAACLALAVVWLAHPTGLLRITAGAPPGIPSHTLAVGQTYYADGYAITLQATPGKSGARTLLVTLRDAQNSPVTSARVAVDITMLDMDMGTEQTVLQPATGSRIGVYQGQCTLSMPGHWELVVRVQPHGRPQVIQAVFVLDVV